jgi:salicylate 5-hydroxylase small subunit
MSASLQAAGVPIGRPTMPSLALRLDVIQLYAEYAACLDEGRIDDWPKLFIEHCHYRLVPRENHDRGLPLATMDLIGRGMLLDRAYAVQGTLFHAPYYQRHILGPVLIKGEADDGIRAECNYLVIRTKRDQMSEVFNAGRTVDRIVGTAEGLRFAEKTCIFDSELVPNSIIYPI